MRVAQDTVAGIATASALAAAGVPWIVTVEPYVHVVASLFAIVGGVLAAWYHWRRIKHLAKKDKLKEDGER